MLSLWTLLCACEVRKGADKTEVASPTAKEEEILNLVLADMQTMSGSCLKPIVSPTREFFWPGAFSFRDGKFARAGDARFDEIARLQTRAKAERSVSIRMPDQYSLRGFRLVENASAVSSCHAQLTLYSPLFDGDFAVVATDVQFAGVAGGDTYIRVFRFRGGRWERYAFGSSGWGRPII